MDHAPRSGKACALLAVLGDAPETRLTRRAIRALLWSDRSEAQGAASLRRLVADLRASLGPHAGILRSEPQWIGLVGVDVARPPPGRAARFAHGLDGRDPALRDWLAARRSAPTVAADAVAEGALHVVVPPTADRDALAGQVILADAAHRALLFRPGMIWSGARDAPADAVLLSATAVDGAAGGLLHVGATRGGVVLSGEVVALSRDGDTAAIAAASARLTRVLLGRTGRILDDLTSFDARRMGDALDLIRSGGAPIRPELSEALLAFGHLCLSIDRAAEPHALDEARRFADSALRAAPRNPLTMASAALVYTNAGREGVAELLTRRAVLADPRNALSHYAAVKLGLALPNATGPPEAADALPGLSPAMLSMVNAAALVRAGRAGDALDHARLAWTLAPSSRPAMRFVAALAYREGQEDEARAALDALEAAEPGFSAGAMAEPDYPVVTLREAGFLDVAYARHLGGRARDAQRGRRGGGRR